MLITRIELTDWGPHTKLVADTRCNVLGVIGANGKGKSNLLQAIDFGLNGNLNKQNKELYIHNFGKPDGAKKATVYIEFEKNGKQGSILREITKTTTKRLLKWEGKEYKSDAEVSAQMELILGADKAAMANAIFCKQGELAKLVKGTPSVRQEIFQKLMNLAFLNARDVDIKNKIERLKQGITDYAPLIDAVRLDISEKTLALSQAHEAVASYRDRTGDIAAIRDYMSAISKLRDVKEEWTQQRAKAIAARSTYVAVVESHGDLNVLRDTSKELRESLTNTKAKLKSIAHAKLIRARVDSNIAAIRDTESHLAALAHVTAEAFNKAKAEVADADEMQRTAHSYADILHRIESASETLQNHKNTQIEVSKAYEDCKARREETRKAEADIVARANCALAILDLRITCLSSDAEFDTCPVCGSHTVNYTKEERESLLAEALGKKKELQDKLQQLKEQTVKGEELLQSALSIKNTVERNVEYSTNMLKDLTEARDKVIATEPWVQNITVHAVDVAADNSRKALDKISKEYTDKVAYESALATLYKERDSLAEADITADDKESETLLSEYVKTTEERLAAVDQAYELVSSQNAAVEAAERLTEQLNESVTEAKTLLTYQFAKCPDTIKTGVLADSTEDEINRCEAIVSQYTAETTSKKSSESVAQMLNEQLLKKQCELDELKKKQESERTRLDLISDLTALRSVVSSSGLPLAYMNAVFGKVSVMVQDMLAQMGANFTVCPAKDKPLTFTFIRTDTGDNYEMPQELLSGGQAIRLSLALLIACQQLILPEVGLLVLDEPSSHLDADGVDSLRELFQKMTKIFNNSNTQLIVVDHAIAMETAFEKFIKL